MNGDKALAWVRNRFGKRMRDLMCIYCIKHSIAIQSITEMKDSITADYNTVILSRLVCEESLR